MELEPMLAMAGRPEDVREGFAHEFKWDGVRVLVHVDDGEVTARSRRGRDVTVTYPEMAELGALGDAVLDGEVVALDDGRPSFALLQRRMNVTDPGRVRLLRAQVPIAYLAFDLLRRDREWLLEEPYEARRAALAGLRIEGENCRVPPGHDDLHAALSVVEDLGLEGLVAKRLGSTYQPGRRSPDWRKLRVMQRQEFVVGGYRPGSGGRSGLLGSLLVGYHDRDGRLVYAGSVGSGLSDAVVAELTAWLDAHRREASPFATAVPHDPVVYAEPALVVEVQFSEWTAGGLLRQPSLKGLRDDRDPREVVREEPAAGPEAGSRRRQDGTETA